MAGPTISAVLASCSEASVSVAFEQVWAVVRLLNMVPTVMHLSSHASKGMVIRNVFGRPVLARKAAAQIRPFQSNRCVQRKTTGRFSPVRAVEGDAELPAEAFESLEGLSGEEVQTVPRDDDVRLDFNSSVQT